MDEYVGSKDAILDMIDYYSQQEGIPSYITSSIIEVESNFDPGNVGDNGTSFGLLQLHTGGGQGDGHTQEELDAPASNLQIGLPYIAQAYKRGKSQGIPEGWEMLQYVASHSGHPSDNGTWTQGYVDMLKKAYDNGDELKGHSGVNYLMFGLGGTYKVPNPPYLSDSQISMKAKTGVGRTTISDMAYEQALSLGLDLSKSYTTEKSPTYFVSGVDIAKYEQGQAYDFTGDEANLEKFYQWALDQKDKGNLTQVAKGTVSADGKTHVAISWNTDVNSGLVGQAKDSVQYDKIAAGSFTVFETMDRWMQIDGTKTGFSYITDNGKALGMRFIFVILGILIFAFALAKLLKDNGSLDSFEQAQLDNEKEVEDEIKAQNELIKQNQGGGS